MASLTITNLHAHYTANTPALQNVSLHVNDGEMVSVVGPSGCGKTTLLRCIAGLKPLTSGTIQLDAEDITSRPPHTRGVAMVFQDHALYPHMSAGENMGAALRAEGHTTKDIRTAVKRMADRLRITTLLNRKPNTLSGGEQQRVAIGAALVRNPRVFLFDEPLSSLDVELRHALRQEIAALQHDLKITTLYVTHDQTEALTLGQRIALLHNGRLVQAAPPQEIFLQPSSRFAAQFLGQPPIHMIRGTLHRDNAQIRFDAQGGSLSLALTCAPDAREVDLGIRPQSLRILDATQRPAADDTLFHACCQTVRFTGVEQWIDCEAGGIPLTLALLSAHDAPPIGASVPVAVSAAACLWFDPHSGQHLPVHQPAPT